MVSVFVSILLKLRITVQLLIQKARVIEQRTHLILADICKQIMENQYGRRGLSHLLESLPKELYCTSLGQLCYCKLNL